MKKKCKLCRKTYYAEHKGRRFCSRSCAVSLRNTLSAKPKPLKPLNKNKGLHLKLYWLNKVGPGGPKARRYSYEKLSEMYGLTVYEIGNMVNDFHKEMFEPLKWRAKIDQP